MEGLVRNHEVSGSTYSIYGFGSVRSAVQIRPPRLVKISRFPEQATNSTWMKLDSRSILWKRWKKDTINISIHLLITNYRY